MSFLQLPPELRNTIYHLVLADSDDIQVEPKSMRTALARTQINSQIRSETSALFYASSTFVVSLDSYNTKQIVAWLGSISPEHLRSIPKLIFKGAGAWSPTAPHGERHGRDVLEYPRHDAREDMKAIRVAVRTAVEQGLRIEVVEVVDEEQLNVGKTPESGILGAMLGSWVKYAKQRAKANR